MQPRLQFRADDDPVDHHLDVVLELLVERYRVAQVMQLTVDTDADVAEALRLVEHIAMLALAALHHRCRDEQARAFRQQHDLVGDLLDRLLADLASTVRAVRMPDARVHEPEVVVDLGDRTDGRTRIPARPLLIDRDRRAQPLDVIDIGFLHLPKELARICAE